jgi:hypothetical protein
MGLTVTLQDSLLNWLRGTAFPAAPSQLFLSFHSAALADSGNEVSANLGGRVLLNVPAAFSVPRDSTAGDPGGPFPAAPSAEPLREIVNNTAIITGLASVDTGVASFGLWSAITSGTLWLRGDVIPDVTIVTGNPGVFLAGDLVLRAAA